MVPNSRKAQRVWEKGRIAIGFDPADWRRDSFWNLINRKAYGNRSSAFGWEIDHIVPVARGGTDDISNLRPLYWEANARRNVG